MNIFGLEVSIRHYPQTVNGADLYIQYSWSGKVWNSTVLRVGWVLISYPMVLH